MKRWTGPVVVSFAVVVALGGCGLAPERVDAITPDIIVGEWRATIDSQSIDLQINPDGTLAFQNMPIEALGFFDGPLDWEKALESTGGDWSLVEDPVGEGDPWFRIHVERIPGDPSTAAGGQIYVQGVEPSVELWQYWNNPEVDPPIVYERVDEPD